MSYGFSFKDVRSVEFGVCLDIDGGEQLRQVPVDKGVQEALKEMLTETFAGLSPVTDLEKYEPAQKYGSSERLSAELSQPYMAKVKSIFETENIQAVSGMAGHVSGIIFYYAVFRDDNKRKLVAIRRGSQFKGVIKAKNRLVSLVDDSLKIIADDVLKLDNDFDYLVFGSHVWILRPTGFAYTAGIEDEILSRSITMTTEITKKLPSVDFSPIMECVKSHRRAARLIASLHSRKDLMNTSPQKLKRECAENGIQYKVKKKQIFPLPGHEIAFLELLDRRRYAVNLTDGEEELFVAGSRHEVNTNTDGK